MILMCLRQLNKEDGFAWGIRIMSMNNKFYKTHIYNEYLEDNTHYITIYYFTQQEITLCALVRRRYICIISYFTKYTHILSLVVMRV